MKEAIVYKNKNGKIVKFEDVRFGGTKYVLFDTYGNYVKDIPVPFKVANYL